MSQPKRYKLVSDGVEEAFVPLDHWDSAAPVGEYVTYADYAALQDQIAVLEAKVEWLRKADRLVVWNGTEWEIRHVQNK